MRSTARVSLWDEVERLLAGALEGFHPMAKGVSSCGS
jgi:hypothetical protein